MADIGDQMKLHRDWFRFHDIASIPAILRSPLGYGVTAWTEDDALSLLSGAVARGWLPQPPDLMTDLRSDPAFASLKGNPQFEKARAQIIGTINRERAQVDQRLLGQLRTA